MNQTVAWVLLRSALFLLFTSSGTSHLLGDEPQKAIVEGDLGRRMDRFVTYTARFANGMSGSVLVAMQGKVVLEKGYGLADKENKEAIQANALWDVASVTKQFTAAAMLHLEMQGKLSLEDTLTKFFPDDIAPHNAAVTLRQLLNHTSGIQNDARFQGVNIFDRDETARYIVKLPQTAKPGARWAYSNIAYFLLGIIIEKVSGQTWEEYLREHLFGPAGMNETYCLGENEIADLESRIPKGMRGTAKRFPYGNLKAWGYAGAGGVHATVRDMYLWDRALRNGKILSEKALSQYYQVGLNKYALGWDVEKIRDGKRVVSHTGTVGGFSCLYLRCLDEDIVIVVLTNEGSRENISLSKWIGDALLGAARGDILAAPDVKPVTISQEDLSKYTGRYQLPDNGALIVNLHPVSGLIIGCDHYYTIRRLKMAENSKLIDDTLINKLNQKLENCLDELKDGEEALLRAELAQSPREQVDEWIKSLINTERRGKLCGHDLLANYLVSKNISNQIVRLRFENGKQNFLLVWEGEKLISISPTGEMAASWHMLPGGEHSFFGKQGDSWRKIQSVTFGIDPAGKATRATLTGFGKQVVAERFSQER